MKRRKKVIKEMKSIAGELVRGLTTHFGEGSAMVLSEGGARDIPSHSTGSIGLDEALGIGGLPSGRVVEVYGPESSGKTTLCLSTIAGVQASGGVAAFVDAEHALSLIHI